MTLSELQTAVYTITNRPDRVAQTLLAIQAATLKAHQSDFYPKDLLETAVMFTTADYLQSFEYRTLIPLYRAIKYIRKSDITMAAGTILELIIPELALDSYHLDREDVFYLAGSVLQIRSSTQLQYIILGCYLNPNITEAGYNSWIALDHPFAIIYEAAANVFKSIGQSEQWTTYSQLAKEEFAKIGVSNIVANGY